MRVSAPKIGFHIVIIYQFEKETNNCVRYYGEKREKEVRDCLQLCLGDVCSQVDILIKNSLQCPSAAKPAWADINTHRVQLSARCLSTFQLSLFGHLTSGHCCEIGSLNCRCDVRKHSFIEILKKSCIEKFVPSLLLFFHFFVLNCQKPTMLADTVLSRKCCYSPLNKVSPWGVFNRGGK